MALTAQQYHPLGAVVSIGLIALSHTSTTRLTRAR
jgi:hypothetical protein